MDLKWTIKSCEFSSSETTKHGVLDRQMMLWLNLHSLTRLLKWTGVITDLVQLQRRYYGKSSIAAKKKTKAGCRWIELLTVSSPPACWGVSPKTPGDFLGPAEEEQAEGVNQQDDGENTQRGFDTVYETSLVRINLKKCRGRHSSGETSELRHTQPGWHLQQLVACVHIHQIKSDMYLWRKKRSNFFSFIFVFA